MPSNIVASYIIIVIFSRNYLRERVAMFTLSMSISPSIASKILSRLSVIEDFPAPVRPTIPTLSCYSIVNVRLDNAGFNPSL